MLSHMLGVGQSAWLWHVCRSHLDHMLGIQGCIEGWPASAAIKFGLRAEERQATNRASPKPRCLVAMAVAVDGLP